MELAQTTVLMSTNKQNGSLKIDETEACTSINPNESTINAATSEAKTNDEENMNKQAAKTKRKRKANKEAEI